MENAADGDGARASSDRKATIKLGANAEAFRRTMARLSSTVEAMNAANQKALQDVAATVQRVSEAHQQQLKSVSRKIAHATMSLEQLEGVAAAYEDHFSDARRAWERLAEDAIRPALEHREALNRAMHMPAVEAAEALSAHRDALETGLSAALKATAALPRFTGAEKAAAQLAEDLVSPEPAGQDRDALEWVAGTAGAARERFGLPADSTLRGIVGVLLLVGRVIAFIGGAIAIYEWFAGDRNTALLKDVLTEVRPLRSPPESPGQALRGPRYAVVQPTVLRSEPSNESDVMDVLMPNHHVSVLDSRGQWLHVRWYDHMRDEASFGWVQARHLKRDQWH